MTMAREKQVTLAFNLSLYLTHLLSFCEEDKSLFFIKSSNIIGKKRFHSV
jgi:hypothetical protein